MGVFAKKKKWNAAAENSMADFVIFKFGCAKEKSTLTLIFQILVFSLNLCAPIFRLPLDRICPPPQKKIQDFPFPPDF